MVTIKIYGASDDLVEVEGQVPGCNEYGSYSHPLYIELSTGDVFKVEYTDAGVWEVRPEELTGKLTQRFEPHGDGGDPEPYTDTVTVSGPIEWVEAWENYPPTVDDMKTKMGKLLSAGDDTIDYDDILSDDEVRAVWAIVANAKRKVK